MQIAVLANENPAGLLLAARLALYSGGDFTVRCSIGGRLSKLLEPGWGLQISNEKGLRVRIKTAILKREPHDPTTGNAPTSYKSPSSDMEVLLWLCDWKDSASTWYALSDCQLIIQTSKAVDSKTVAMWLVEVCADDAVVISLQSGLHNVRELREVFGRSREENSPRIMPLFANKPKARAGSDELSAARSRSDSQASFLEELENDLDEDQRAQSPAPPASKRNSLLGGLTPNSSHTDLRGLGRHSFDSSLDDGGKSANSVTSANVTAKEDLLKPDVIILAGVLGFQSCAVMDEATRTIKVFPTTDAAMVVERLSRDKEKRSLRPVSVLERARFHIKWRPAPELNNWLWGDLVWRTFDAYGAALHLIEHPNVVPNSSSSSAKGRSLYALLNDKDDTHRRVFAGLIDEALLALQWQKVELMDPATSPLFGLGFRRARAFLLLPRGLFSLVLKCLVVLTLTNSVRNDSPFGDVSVMHKYMAAFLNGEVVRIGFESDILTPINQELMEALSSTASLPTNTPHDRLVKSPLPPLLGWSSVLLILSGLVALFAILVQFLVFVYEVMVYW